MSETFPEMLRRLRTERSLSQTELSRRSNLNASYVHLLERTDSHNRQPTKPVLLALGRALDMSHAELDRFLWLSGFAPVTDWQGRAEMAEATLSVIRAALGADEVDEPTEIRRRTG